MCSLHGNNVNLSSEAKTNKKIEFNNLLNLMWIFLSFFLYQLHIQIHKNRDDSHRSSKQPCAVLFYHFLFKIKRNRAQNEKSLDLWVWYTKCYEWFSNRKVVYIFFCCLRCQVFWEIDAKNVRRTEGILTIKTDCILFAAIFYSENEKKNWIFHFTIIHMSDCVNYFIVSVIIIF